MKKADIQEVLDWALQDIARIESSSKEGRADRKSIKDALQNLRSALDYSALAIAQNLPRPPSKKRKRDIYFPYSKSREGFAERAEENLYGVSEKLPAVMKELVKLQPFNTGGPWLKKLIELTNGVKHKHPGKYEETHEMQIIQGGVPVAKFTGPSSVMLSGNIINGVVQDTVKIHLDGRVDIIPTINQTGITSRNVILFDGERIEAVPFLKHCHDQISNYIEKISKLLQDF